VDELRRSTLASKRKAALDKRQRILSSMGMAQAPATPDGSVSGGTPPSKGSGKNKVVVSEARAALMEELQEEAGHVCVVCGEGEAYRPGEVLGTYVFTKRVPLPPPPATFLDEAEPTSPLPAYPFGAASLHAALGLGLGAVLLGSAGGVSPSDCCHTTVTHFNTIHVRCHREASAAERNLKAPKEEWEGATLRNSGTRTNGLLPFWGATVSEEAYAAVVDTFWAQVHGDRPTDHPTRLSNKRYYYYCYCYYYYHHYDYYHYDYYHCHCHY